MSKSMFRGPVAAAVLLFASAVGAPTMAASLIGDSITATYYFPDTATVYGGYSVSPADTFTVGAGVEATGTVDGFATTDFDFDANSLTMTITADTGYSGASFNGWQFLNNSAAYGSILSVTGIDASRVSAAGNVLGVNWESLSFADGDQIVITFGVVPEPASWALMIAGFGMVGFAMRRRQVALTA